MSDAATSTSAPAGNGLTPIMLSHAAWVTHDVAATTDFYTRIMGMALASTIFDDKVPSTEEPFPYFHIFFRMQDGSTLAFFDAPGVPKRAEPSHPAYRTFEHTALQAANREEVDAWAAWLKSNDIEIIGPTNHKGLIYSIYFHDPNGYRLEITAPLSDRWNQNEAQAKADLNMWVNGLKEAREIGKDVVSHMIELIRKERQRYNG